jgi:hypothetical protein
VQRAKSQALGAGARMHELDVLAQLEFTVRAGVLCPILTEGPTPFKAPPTHCFLAAIEVRHG